MEQLESSDGLNGHVESETREKLTDEEIQKRARKDVNSYYEQLDREEQYAERVIDHFFLNNWEHSDADDEPAGKRLKTAGSDFESRMVSVSFHLLATWCSSLMMDLASKCLSILWFHMWRKCLSKH